MNNIKLKYSLTNEDFLEHQLYIASKSKNVIKKRKRTRVIIPLIYLVIALSYFFSKGNYTVSLIFISISIIWYLFYPIRSKKLHIKHYQNHINENYKNRIHVESEIEITNDYIFGKEKTNESKTSIEEVESLIELKTRFFLKLKTGLSLIIPKVVIGDISNFKNKFIELNINIIDESDWEFK
ncbi:MAG: hypothetical protein ABJK28_08965 [Algibacter sp.]